MNRKEMTQTTLQAAIVERIRSKFGTVSNFARLHGLKIYDLRKMIKYASSDLTRIIEDAEKRVPAMTSRKIRGYVVMIYGGNEAMAKAEKISRKSVDNMIAGKKNIAWVRLIKRIREGAVK